MVMMGMDGRMLVLGKMGTGNRHDQGLAGDLGKKRGTRISPGKWSKRPFERLEAGDGLVSLYDVTSILEILARPALDRGNGQYIGSVKDNEFKKHRRHPYASYATEEQQCGSQRKKFDGHWEGKSRPITEARRPDSAKVEVNIPG